MIARITALVLLCAAASVAAQETATDEAKHSAAEARKRAIAAVPDPQAIFIAAKRADAAAKLPLLVYLHGKGSSPQRAVAGLRPLAESGVCSVLLCCGSDKLGMRADGACYGWAPQTDLDAILAEIEKREGIDRGQVYLAGFSMGANMSYLAMLTRPGVFAGVIAFGGHLQPEFIAAAAQGPAAKKPPVFIVHGRNDTVMPFALAGKAERWLLDHDYPVQVRPFDGGHKIPPGAVGLIEEALTWFREQEAARSR
jgi:poly(3-hydroxybutyrate) depolymerase